MEIDLSNLDLGTRRKVDEIFRRDYDLKVHQAMLRQRALAAKNCLNPGRARQDIGPLTFQVEAMIDSIWRQFYGHDYTANDDLVKFLVRRNPEIRVKQAGTKVMAGWMPSAATARHHKTY